MGGVEPRPYKGCKSYFKVGFIGLFANVKRFVFTKPSSGRKGDHEVVEGARVQQKI